MKNKQITVELKHIANYSLQDRLKLAATGCIQLRDDFMRLTVCF